MGTGSWRVWTCPSTKTYATALDPSSPVVPLDTGAAVLEKAWCVLPRASGQASALDASLGLFPQPRFEQAALFVTSYAVLDQSVET